MNYLFKCMNMNMNENTSSSIINDRECGLPHISFRWYCGCVTVRYTCSKTKKMSNSY